MPSDSVIRAAEFDRQNWLGLVSGSFRYSVEAIGPSPIGQLVRPTPRNGDRVVCARDYCATALTTARVRRRHLARPCCNPRHRPSSAPTIDGMRGLSGNPFVQHEVFLVPPGKHSCLHVHGHGFDGVRWTTPTLAQRRFERGRDNGISIALCQVNNSLPTPKSPSALSDGCGIL